MYDVSCIIKVISPSTSIDKLMPPVGPEDHVGPDDHVGPKDHIGPQEYLWHWPLPCVNSGIDNNVPLREALCKEKCCITLI